MSDSPQSLKTRFMKRFEKKCLFCFQVKDIILEPEMWSIENNKLTPTFKSKREELLKHYQVDIDEMYQHCD